jgi:hypothetical protein
MTDEVNHEFGAVGLGRRGGDLWLTDLMKVAYRSGGRVQSRATLRWVCGVHHMRAAIRASLGPDPEHAALPNDQSTSHEACGGLTLREVLTG